MYERFIFPPWQSFGPVLQQRTLSQAERNKPARKLLLLNNVNPSPLYWLPLFDIFNSSSHRDVERVKFLQAANSKSARLGIVSSIFKGRLGQHL